MKEDRDNVIKAKEALELAEPGQTLSVSNTLRHFLFHSVKA